MHAFRFRRFVVVIAVLVAAPVSSAAASAARPAAAPNAYTVTKLVADQAGKAPKSDPDLVDPWGMTSSASGPWWVSDRATSRSTIYTLDGTKNALVVSTGGQPTGVVFNPKSAEFDGNSYLYATLGGGIEGWKAADGTHTILYVDHSVFGTVYTGLTIGTNSSGDFLFAADFHDAEIDVFDASFHPASVAGRFLDPSLPAGYAPFNVQNLGGFIYVTYALQDPTGTHDVPGPGHGIVDQFDADGILLNRIATGGALNSPWGLAVAPTVWGKFSNDLLVGNHGNGRINAYHVKGAAWAHHGVLDLPKGTPLKIAGLRAIALGNGGNGGPVDHLFFTAGPKLGARGLFGYVAAE